MSVQTAAAAERRDVFVRRAVERHGDRFEYDLTTYRGDYRPMTVTCTDHGQFTVTPVMFLASPVGGCVGCGVFAGQHEHDLTAFDIAAGGFDVVVHVELGRDEGVWVSEPRPGFDIALAPTAAASSICDAVLEQFAFGDNPRAWFASDTKPDGDDHPKPYDQATTLVPSARFRIRVTADNDRWGGCQFDCEVLADDIDMAKLPGVEPGEDAAVFAVHEQ